MVIPESRHPRDDHWHTDVPRRHSNRDWMRLWAGIALLAILIGMVWLMGGDAGGQPMPCERDEVYVWETYPHDAACVDATDHEHHT